MGSQDYRGAEPTLWQKIYRDAFIKSMSLLTAGMAFWIAADMQTIKNDFKRVNEIQISQKSNIEYAGKLLLSNRGTLAVLCRNMIKDDSVCR